MGIRIYIFTIQSILIIYLITSVITNAQQPNLEWLRGYGSASAGAMAIDSLGNVYVAGQDGGSPPGFVTVKYSPSGQQLWAVRFFGGAGFVARPVVIVCDQQGNVYVGAYDDSYILIKYNTNGVRQWFKRFNARYLSDMVITPSG